MVRTKADAATRVAAGGKAPKKAANRVHHSPSTSPTPKLGKDNLPVNRYCPRETPSWQKKITCFYDKNREKNDSDVSSKTNDSNALLKDNEIDNITGKFKRKSSEIDCEDEMIIEGSDTKKVKTSNMETDEHINVLENCKEEKENASMEMED